MKKYHQRPTFGVRSGTVIWTPYVALMKDHGFCRISGVVSDRAERLPMKEKIWRRMKARGVEEFDFWPERQHRRRRGGMSKAGYSDKYVPNASASIQCVEFPVTAFTIACAIAVFVRMFVDLPKQLIRVKGLKRYRAARIVPSRCTGRDETNTPFSAIVLKARAFRVSRAVKMSSSGMVSKRASRRGGWWKTPPSYGDRPR